MQSAVGPGDTPVVTSVAEGVQSADLDPGMRVIELHILGVQVALQLTKSLLPETSERLKAVVRRYVVAAQVISS